MHKISNKKGQAFEFIVATAMIAISLTSVYLIVDEGNKIYIGDNSTNLYYEYSNCPEIVDHLNQSNLRLLDSKNQAENKGYKEGCR